MDALALLALSLSCIGFAGFVGAIAAAVLSGRISQAEEATATFDERRKAEHAADALRFEKDAAHLRQQAERRQETAPDEAAYLFREADKQKDFARLLRIGAPLDGRK